MPDKPRSFGEVSIPSGTSPQYPTHGVEGEIRYSPTWPEIFQLHTPRPASSVASLSAKNNMAKVLAAPAGESGWSFLQTTERKRDIFEGVGRAEMVARAVAVVSVLFVLSLLGISVIAAGGSILNNMVMYGVLGLAVAFASVFAMIYDAEIHSKWLRPGSPSFFITFALIGLVTGGAYAGRKFYFERNPPLSIACAFIANLVVLVAGTAVAVPSARARTRDP